MATPSHFMQCYSRAPEYVVDAGALSCPLCNERFAAGARYADQYGVGVALYCQHHSQLLVARPMWDNQVELTIAGPLTESAAMEIVSKANAEQQHLTYGLDPTH